ncbi:MAG: protein tyrosine phosphatase [Pseudomonadota bacterium]
MLGDHGALRLAYDATHVVDPGRVWRTYQPSPGRLKKLKALGIRTILNLRGDQPSGFYFLEEEACEALGLKLATFRAYSREAPSAEFLHGARALFKEMEYPVAMHCKSGADRVGLMSTLYLYFEKGVPLRQALGQLSLKYGHVRAGKTGVIDYAFEKFLAYADARGLPADVDLFFKWVDGDYDPKETKREFLGSWWGNLLTERILRRE